MRKILFLYGFLFVTLIAQSQHIIKGTVQDSTSNEPISDVYIIGLNNNLEEVKQGQVEGLDIIKTEVSGQFEFTVKNLPLELQFYKFGYHQQTIVLTKIPKNELVINLLNKNNILGTVVVTGSRYEKNIADEATSIEVIRPEFIERNAITSLENVMERTPGVQILDGQVNLRSSGYAQGAGSRVGMYVDGQPMLTATASNIQWNLVPIENIEQIEVVKGAASVLYGAAAMNGVINVRTAEPSSKPYTSIALYGGVSDEPQDAYKNWWTPADLPTPKNYGVLFAHRQKFGKLDVVLGGNVHENISHIKGDDESRYRFNIKTKYRITDRLTAGVNASWMRYSLPPYFLWEDGDTNILRPIDTLIDNNWMTYSIDPHLTYFGKKDGKHTLNGRFFQTTFIRNNNDNTPAYVVGGEYQYQKKWTNLILTSGLSHQNIFSRSLSFRPNPDGSIGENNASITAFFLQNEYSLLKDKLTLIGGLRWEFLSVGGGDYSRNFPIGRLSATYKAAEKNVFRFSSGQGYRLPSLSERYIDQLILEVENPIGLDGVRVIANPDLRPEIGWTGELGYKRLFSKNGWSGYLDAAFFVMEYQDLANFVFDFHKDLDRPTTIADILAEPELFGFSTVNIDQGRIAGFEVGGYLSGKVGQLPFRFWGGYTYTYPANLDSLRQLNQGFWTNFGKAFTLNDETILPSILNYRSLHVFKMDWEFYIKDFTLGFVGNFNGFMHNIDPILEGKGEWGNVVRFALGDDLLPGLIPFREAHQNGDWVFDLRMGYQLNRQNQINFMITNLFNREYALRVGRINPLRMFNVKYQLTF